MTTGSYDSQPTKVFLSYAFEDGDLAERLAAGLTRNGILTFFAGWDMKAGDSIRQTIDQALGECTHFIVLLTPNSIARPWVNLEMDAGLVRRLADKSRFIPLRAGLDAAALPATISGLLSPSIDEFDAALERLVADILNVSRKPPLGPTPQAMANRIPGWSPAAAAVARQFVLKSRNGIFGDPTLRLDDLVNDTGLPREDVEDAMHELWSYFTVSHDQALAKSELFVEFDSAFMVWTAADDGLRLATDILNDPSFPERPEEIAKRYGWAPRRLNPAIAYLQERRLIQDCRGVATAPWFCFSVRGHEGDLRRFVRSRS